MTVSSTGREARTRYEVRQRFTQPIDASLLECRLETGRTHQIRVHLAAIGHPLVGDPAYGARRSADVPQFHRQALHAARLGLVHPATGKPMAWNAPPPADLAALIDALRARDPSTQ